jgi:hypothetical protein
MRGFWDPLELFIGQIRKKMGTSKVEESFGMAHQETSIILARMNQKKSGNKNEKEGMSHSLILLSIRRGVSRNKVVIL